MAWDAQNTKLVANCYGIMRFAGHLCIHIKVVFQAVEARVECIICFALTHHAFRHCVIIENIVSLMVLSD